VLRRIIRRAIRHGYHLGQRTPFFFGLVDALDDVMGEAYPALTAAREQVKRVLRLEEERFAETLEQGMRILDEAIDGLAGKEIPGATVFKLYDTYGFPADLTADIARERGLSLDMAGFEREMEAQRERARAASHFGADESVQFGLEGETDFTGYERVVDEATVIALFAGGASVDRLGAGESGLVVLDRTPFYAESGGQVGDRGLLLSKDDTGRFRVEDTRKQGGAVIGHVGRVERDALHVGDLVEARIDADARRATALNHSATHLMHAALRRVLGPHVQQKGSLVAPDRLRFDFAHFEPVTREQIREIERLVNGRIRENDMVETRIMSLEDAKASGAMALFGEKYGERVRVLRMGDFSTELCGGTHVRAVGDIGFFKIVAESGVAAGVRRIEAVTGANAVAWVEREDERLQNLATTLKAGRDDVEDKVAQLLERSRRLEKELEQLKARLASAAGSDLAASAVEVGGVKVLAARLDSVDPKALRETLDQLKSRLGRAVVVLGAVSGDRVNLVAGVTADCTDRVRAGELVNLVAQRVGGKGGGRADMAQAGGTDPAGLPDALALVEPWVRERLSA